MSTKINQIRQKILPDGIMLSKWLREQGITTSDQSSYLKHKTIERIATGVYKFPESKPTEYGILSSYQEQTKNEYHIGASSALEIKGISHYIPIGNPRLFIFTPLHHRLPKWINSSRKDSDIIELSPNVLGNIGKETINHEKYKLTISSPELAIMECLLLSPKFYDLMDTFHLLEMLTNLRSSLVQEILENCKSIKVKRMFLYMACKANHQWYNKLDLSKINLGSGTRSYAKHGVKDSHFNIVIPRELYQYE